jgi:hypothetical protein
MMPRKKLLAGGAGVFVLGSEAITAPVL